MLPDATESKRVACIGDEEHISRADRGSGGGVFVIPTNPSVAVPLTLKLENCRVCFPDRSALDMKIRNIISRSVAVSTGDQSAEFQVLSRSIKIGMCDPECISFRTLEIYFIITFFGFLHSSTNY
jgi:hypothetical protein